MVDTRGFDPQTGEWNDTLTGDFVWGNTNIGEALSCVVTPFTWSVIGMAYDYMSVLPGHHAAGNIGGRPYQNGTVMAGSSIPLHGLPTPTAGPTCLIRM